MVVSTLQETFVLIGLVLYYLLEAFANLIIPKPKKDVTDQLVVITGAGQGLGKEIAIRFAQSKAKIAILDINEASINQTKEELEERFKVDVRSYVCNVSNESEVNQCFDKIKKDFGQRIEILVNNAAITNCLPIDKVESSAIERIFQVNVFSQFWTIRNVLKSMKENNSGHIVTIGSIAGYIGTPNIVDYSATKFAVRGMIESLREELRAGNFDGIKMTICNPVAMNTTMFKKPTTRFDFIVPIVTPEKVADALINGVLRDDELVNIPSYMVPMTFLSFFFPIKVKYLVQDFLDYKVGEHN